MALRIIRQILYSCPFVFCITWDIASSKGPCWQYLWQSLATKDFLFLFLFQKLVVLSSAPEVCFDFYLVYFPRLLLICSATYWWVFFNWHFYILTLLYSSLFLKTESKVPYTWAIKSTPEYTGTLFESFLYSISHLNFLYSFQSLWNIPLNEKLLKCT